MVVVRRMELRRCAVLHAVWCYVLAAILPNSSHHSILLLSVFLERKILFVEFVIFIVFLWYLGGKYLKVFASHTDFEEFSPFSRLIWIVAVVPTRSFCNLLWEFHLNHHFWLLSHNESCSLWDDLKLIYSSEHSLVPAKYCSDMHIFASRFSQMLYLSLVQHYIIYSRVDCRWFRKMIGSHGPALLRHFQIFF